MINIGIFKWLIIKYIYLIALNTEKTSVDSIQNNLNNMYYKAFMMYNRKRV